ncbi:MAG: lactonase family protein, partial [Flavobacterium sp.]
ETGDYDKVTSTENITSPSFISISDDKKFIYSVNENDDDSTISAFRFDDLASEITLLNQQASKGIRPCNIINDDHNVIVANYESGTIGVFGKGQDGSISAAKQAVAHHGSGPNDDRQEKAHAHMVGFSPDSKYVFVTDLGTDSISSYRYNPSEMTDVLVLENKISLKPASGPRHFEFSPNGKNLYVIHELDGTLTVFDYHEGQLGKLQETTIAQDGFEGETASGDIHCSADGKFVYATNRGDANTISQFSVADDGKLKHVETISIKGDGPRNFAITPNGRFLLIGHENSNEIVFFSRDPQSGRLSDTNKKIELCSPVCLKFVVYDQRSKT